MVKLRSLNQLRGLRLILTATRKQWLVRFRHAVLHPSASISLSARLIGSADWSITIGEDSLIAFKTLLMTHHVGSDHYGPIIIGRRCFIGGGSTIMPGVTIGDESIVAAGAVVFSDVPPNCIAAGNPAKIIRTGITVGKFGRLSGADDNSRRLWRP